MELILSIRFYFLIYLILLPICLQSQNPENQTDYISLLKFKQGITSDPHGIFKSWNSSLHFCSWFGVTCGHRHQRVTSLTLQGQNLVGSVSPYIGNLSFIRILDLQNNTFRGNLPPETGNLFRLQRYLVNNNSISGEIPKNLSMCKELRTIFLRFNQFEGRIPPEIGSLAKLEILVLDGNYIGGEIPPSLSNLSSLTTFSIAENNLAGNIPAELARLKSVTYFSVGENYLSGMVPPSLFNISSVLVFSTVNNQLYGTVPSTIGLTLPNLQAIHLGGNNFSGPIPTSISNASHLNIFDVIENKFEGQVPNLGNHPNLSRIGLSHNDLGTNSPSDLMFLASLKNSTNLEVLAFTNNNFGGVMSDSVANLSKNLYGLFFGSNQFTGNIPEALVNLVSLVNLGMENNAFTGAIPSGFGKFQYLQGLHIWNNRLSGPIPSALGNLSQLSILALTGNHLTGNIPSSIGNCTRLNSLYLAQNDLEGHIPFELMLLPSLSVILSLEDNSLSGNLPVEVGKLRNLNTLDVSENKLSGKIPTAIGDCSALEYLYLQGNDFRGAIPLSLASLRGLQEVDLSRNNLTGEIPQGFQNLTLRYLNLSLNDLEGEVPTDGVFRNVTALSLVGNSKLCGGIPQLLLQKCQKKRIEKGLSHSLKIAIIATCVLLGVSFVLASILVYRRKKSETNLSDSPLIMDHLVKVSYHDLHLATDGFSSENLIGSGSFGFVYKGKVNQIEKPIAIKVLKLEHKNAFKTLIAECNVLKNVRHRNLVKLLSYCSSLDYKRNEFKALIFEFMENGSLDSWLHLDNRPRYLSFLQRLNIAIDVASALHYLHDLYERSIVHCDLKPGNVLLDNHMVARVSDFGLARFLSTNNDLSQSRTSTSGIKGTVGYAPPEYGMGNPASREGDAYSYGILVLEMFSGKRPTDVMFEDGLNLHNFVKNALPGRLVGVVDPSIARELEEASSHRQEIETSNMNQRANQESLVSVLELGIACSRESPEERMKMGDVVKALHLIRSSFLGVRVYEK
ncbi:Receptor kinase-like protein Xa21 [Euphorbia peplus]|nr:Receptor kinase-like protein Xa21 [Euphorbia peplus]